MTEFSAAQVTELLGAVLELSMLFGAVGSVIVFVLLFILQGAIKWFPQPPLTVEQEEKLIARIRATCAFERSKKGLK